MPFGNYPAEDGPQMDGVNPVETFPEAGIRRGFRDTEEGAQVAGYRWIIHVATGLAVTLQERGHCEKEHRHSRQQTVPEYFHSLNGAKPLSKTYQMKMEFPLIHLTSGATQY